jgi:hypothetical protein
MGIDPQVVGGSASEEWEPPLAWEWRTLAVSAFLTLPGGVLGALLRLCVPTRGQRRGG